MLIHVYISTTLRTCSPMLKAPAYTRSPGLRDLLPRHPHSLRVSNSFALIDLLRHVDAMMSHSEH